MSFDIASISTYPVNRLEAKMRGTFKRYDIILMDLRIGYPTSYGLRRAYSNSDNAMFNLVINRYWSHV